MASENLINDLFEIIQANSKEKISYNDFESDLLKNINLPNDEIDRALSLIISQAEVNPNVVGETKGGSFMVSSSFSASIVATIKYENQFIEGKQEYINKNDNNKNLAGILLTAGLVDSMLNNFEQLTSNDISKLYEDYSKLSDEQQRRLDAENIKRLTNLEREIGETKDETSKGLAKQLVLDAKDDAKSAEDARTGEIDQEKERNKMKKAEGFADFLLKKYGIVLTEKTQIDKTMIFYFNEFKGGLRERASELLKTVSGVNTLLLDGRIEEFSEMIKRNPALDELSKKYVETYRLIEAGVIDINLLDENQKAIHRNFAQYMVGYVDDIHYEPGSLKDYLPEEAYTAFGVGDPQTIKFLKELQNRDRRDNVVETQETIDKSDKVEEILIATSNALINYGSANDTILNGLNEYSLAMDFVVDYAEKTEAEKKDFEWTETPEEWPTSDFKTDNFYEMFKAKLQEESDKTRKMQPSRSEVLDVLKGITYGGTIEERMSDVEKVKQFGREVTHSIDEISKKIKHNIPFDERTNREVDNLIEMYMKTHGEDLFVGEIPTERVPAQDDIGLYEGITQINSEPIIETPIVEQQEDTEVIESKDDEVKVGEEGKEDKKSDFFSPSDFSNAKNLFSSIRTSAYVSMFEEVKGPLSQQEPKKTNEDQGRTDDEEPGQ